MKPKSFHSSFAFVRGVRANIQLIDTVQQLLDHIQYIQDAWKVEDLWFRGLSHSKYHLIPSIYRSSIWKYRPSDATDTYTEFLRRGKPFIRNQGQYSKSESYYLMQHYGVPTRLLDWTQGAMVALFFALRKLSHIGNPCIWVLDPWWLNRISTDNDLLFYTDPAYQDEADKTVSQYFEDETKLPDYPVALLPSHIDVRIISQKSVFTIHGKKKDGFLDLINQHKDARIIKLRIDGKKAKVVRDQVETLGITETTLFPDLEGLAREIKREYNMR